MQILNITAMLRPSTSVTSKPYPVGVLEGFGVALLDLIGGQTNIPFQESTASTAQINQVYVRELLVTLPVETESVRSVGGIAGLRLTRDVVYVPLSVESESTRSTATIASLRTTREVRYIPYHSGVESTSSTASVLGVREK